MSRDLITCGLGYVLMGFALDWAARHYKHGSELGSVLRTAVPILFWPLALSIGVVLGFVLGLRQVKERRKGG